MVSVEFSADDAEGLARWWAAALGWRAEDAIVWPDGPGVAMRFISPATPKTSKNGIHLDLRSEDHHDQRKTVERLFNAGAGFADIGQGDAVPWVVMSDPEGNELCVLEPREVYHDTGPLAAIVIDCADPHAQVGIWSSVTGQPVTHDEDGYAGLQLKSGPYLEFLQSPTGPEGRLRLLTGPVR
ncbi:hypothetical protein A8924_1967 [Saccharopolyspora erythraea NRRL 2338]|uniref:Uncharacterized protein n=2 Tax=Saccharopolyspora erythraea TaxID=1836 RepID=A4FA14_SACEN|nr:VOC family protein [Saccharopolyspora erythraea]EQD85645.1 hypothetical protein N599_13790 [Saccharopolyspora erythraea D]PFG94674.1 hypothetical protein A8924_1967 [Saccharopolyspora erythraea NRRL 2338]QRK91404.1 glyoxalase/bleomycin resistance/dioxygenase family protein [Saccharopolyspora erythraea]CAM00889.1 hypothetical protein SACE_1567 [Saccharopolyspora erythraea NRRL 2338]